MAKQQQTRPSFGPLLAVIFVIFGVYATIANQSRQRPSSAVNSSPTPSPKPSASSLPAPVSTQKTAGADPIRPQPTFTGLSDGNSTNATPPVQALDIETPPKEVAEPPPTKQNAVPATVVAPTCEYLASYVRTNNLCAELEQVLCWSPGMVEFEMNHVRALGDKDHLEMGNSLVSKRKFRQAISEYTKELKLEPHYPEALMKRALAYAALSEKPAAMADYCSVLSGYSTFAQKAAALERIAELSGLRLQKDVAPIATTSEATKPPLPLPTTGDIRPQRRRNAKAPFTIKTTRGANYLVKLVNLRNANDQIWVFVRGGETYKTLVPVGTYSLRMATGNTWYGRDDLFGPETRFIRLKNKGMPSGKSPFTLEFREERNRVIGTIISLEAVVDGNLEQETMTRAEFDAN